MTNQLQRRLRRRPQGTGASLQQDGTGPHVNAVGIEPSTDAARALYQSDFGRGELSCEMVGGGESRYASSEDGYMRFFPSAE